ncbi:MAG TPA: hypothetical protein PKW35_04530 [Nannocystaceae bacterium]|nr:hypothetical protein [Nannocystaceae bacterium]
MSISMLWPVPSAIHLVSLHRAALIGALALAPACVIKGGDDTGASSESSSTGESTGTEGGSSTSGSGGSASSEPATTGGSGITSDSGSATGDPTSTSGNTSMSGSGDPTGDPTGDPPAACEGDPKALDFVTSMAYLKSQVPPDMTTSGGSSSSGGPEIDPATLYVKLSSQSFTCKDPNAVVDCGPEWEVTIVIPPEFQTPGAIYDLAGQDVFATFIETGADEGGNVCSFGGGSGGGTFQILDIDDNQVTGRLCNVPTWFFTETMPDLEGTFVADRCP